MPDIIQETVETAIKAYYSQVDFPLIDPELHQAKERFIRFFCELAVEADKHLLGRDQETWYHVCEAEFYNFNAALNVEIHKMIVVEIIII